MNKTKTHVEQMPPKPKPSSPGGAVQRAMPGKEAGPGRRPAAAMAPMGMSAAMSGEPKRAQMAAAMQRQVGNTRMADKAGRE
jgi:hypothetical protein